MNLSRHIFFIIPPLLFLFSGCAGSIKYNTLENYVSSGNCRLAVEYLQDKESAYGNPRRLNFLLDSAMINMLCGKYEESNRYLHEAERLAEKLWTRSLTGEAASLLINDYTLPYRGEDFEKALVNLFSAINYLMLDNYEEALVECRRLDSLLTLLNDKYDKKNVYKEDAFGRYLSGMIYESEGSMNDAYIDYYKALKTYESYREDYGTPVPKALTADLYRVAEATGRLSEIRLEFSYYGEKNRRTDREETGDSGKIVMIHFNGKSPVKLEDRIIVVTKYGPVSIAFPRYAVNRPACRESSLKAVSKAISSETRSELAEDINEIALKNLDDRKGRIMIKAVARAAAKQAAINNLVKDDSLRKVFNLLNTAFVERADTRTWRTLPGEIYLAKLHLPPGDYEIEADSCGRKYDLGKVSLRPGETEFVLLDTVY